MKNNSYRSTLSPWAIYRWISPTYSECIKRFRKRGDAEEHLRLLRQATPSSRMEIVFDLSNADLSGD